MDSTPVTRRSKRLLPAAQGTKKKQKTSTPSQSRIEQYMSPGNMSKVVGSPIQHPQSTLHSIDEESDRSAGGERSRLSRMLSYGDQNRNTGRKTIDRVSRPGDKGDAEEIKSDQRSVKTSGAHSVQRVTKKGQRSKLQRLKSSSQKAVNLSSTLQNATIDKYMSPDLSSSAVSTPTRFPKSADNASSSENEEAHNVSQKRKSVSKQKSNKTSSEEEPSTTSSVTKQEREITGKYSSRFLASGDVTTHMEDKEFLASQVLTLSKPFILEEGPSQWINTWKARQSQNDEEETEPIPEKVMHKALAKLNSAMIRDLGLNLSRQQQRKVLMSLDEVRKERHDAGIDDRLKGMLNTEVPLPEILEHYPSEWPGTEESLSDDEMAQRYQDVHRRLSALTESLSRKEEEKEHLQNTRKQLQEIDENLRSCTDGDFKKEIDRTKSLVSQILKKLTQRRSPRKHITSTDGAANKGAVGSKESFHYQPVRHEAIIRQLFASTF